MSIIESNIKLLQSERLNDNADGGGFMTGNVVADGVENNLFPDVSDADRTFGRVQLRKVYAAVTSADSDTYMGAHAIIDDVPGDPAVSALMVSKAGYSQVRADLVSALDNSSYKVAVGATKRAGSSLPWSAGVTNTITAGFTPPRSYLGGGLSGSTPGELRPGDRLGLFEGAPADPIPATSAMEIVTVQSVATSFSLGDTTSTITLTAPVLRNYPNTSTYFAVKLSQDTANGALEFYGQAVTSAALSVNDATIPLVSSSAAYIPVASGGVYPTVPASILGVDPTAFITTGGRVGIFRPNGACVVHDTQTTAPATVTNGQDVNLGRTRLAKARVIGANGVEITTGFTTNLVTGHVVFSNVAGYSQPVTIQHRIEDMLLVSEAGASSLVVARGVTHAYPSGAKVSSVLMFGDMQARIHDGFQQTTWTGVWSDTVIGSTPTAAYNEAANPITVTNAGAISERWAVIFTSATGFRVIGEQVGEVVASGGGSTSSITAPLNPATGAPYFSIPAAGWGSGWAAGNVYRFNTDGANAPLWLIRSVAPSDPFAGQSKFTVAIRGNVNA